MFMVDVETLSISSEAAILSLAAIQFEPEDTRSFDEFRNSAFFVKFKAKDQITRLGRTMTKSSVEWWGKQCDLVRKQSFIPAAHDVLIEDGFEKFRAWANSFPEKDTYVWARGNLDQLVIDSAEERMGIKPVFFFNRWRDVRTAVDFLTGSTNGYCAVDVEGFDPKSVVKHCPINDCALDVMMLLRGVKSE